MIKSSQKIYSTELKRVHNEISNYSTPSRLKYLTGARKKLSLQLFTAAFENIDW